jgi:AraC-like DNA-binding protein
MAIHLANEWDDAINEALSIPCRRILGVWGKGEPFGTAGCFDYPVVSLLTSGRQSIRYYSNERLVSKDLSPGDACYIPSGRPFDVSWDAPCRRLGIGCTADWLKVSWHDCQSIPGSDLIPNPVLWYSEPLPDGEEIYSLFQAAGQRWRQTREDAISKALLNLIVLKVQEIFSAFPCEDRPGLTTFERLKAYVDDHFASPISRQSVADYFNLNPDYITRLFNEELGKGFTDYLIDQRMKKARDLLGQTNLPTKQVATLCGFAYDNYFARVFRRRHHRSPQEFRKEGKQE